MSLSVSNNIAKDRSRHYSNCVKNSSSNYIHWNHHLQKQLCSRCFLCMLIKSRPRQWMCISIITYSISKGKHHLVLRVLLCETCDLCVCKRPRRNMIWLLSVLFDRCVHCCKHLQLTIKTIK